MSLCIPRIVFAPRINTAWKKRGMLDFVESVLLLNTFSQVLGVRSFFECQLFFLFFFKSQSLVHKMNYFPNPPVNHIIYDCLSSYMSSCEVTNSWLGFSKQSSISRFTPRYTPWLW